MKSAVKTYPHLHSRAQRGRRATFNVIKSGNRENLIRCVRSVAALKTEHEHLVYDGVSDDGTVDLLRDLEAKTTGLKVTSEPDCGIYDALNKGVRDAKGEWFYVLGADDYIFDPTCLDDLINRIPLGKGVVGSPVRRDDMAIDFANEKILRYLFIHGPFSHQGTLVRTVLVRKHAGFDKRYKVTADYDQMFRMHCWGEPFWYDFSPYAHFSTTGVSSSDEGHSEVVKVLRDRLSLTEADCIRLQEKRVLPFLAIKPYLFHRDKALRLASRFMFLRGLFDVFGLLDSKGNVRSLWRLRQLD